MPALAEVHPHPTMMRARSLVEALVADTNIRKHVGELPPWRCPAGQYDNESRELNDSKAVTNCDNCNELRRERAHLGRSKQMDLKQIQKAHSSGGADGSW